MAKDSKDSKDSKWRMASFSNVNPAAMVTRVHSYSGGTFPIKPSRGVGVSSSGVKIVSLLFVASPNNGL